jgi:hypothetical protein
MKRHIGQPSGNIFFLLLLQYQAKSLFIYNDFKVNSFPVLLSCILHLSAFSFVLHFTLNVCLPSFPTRDINESRRR